ncbi:hypothetical protein [Virgibacillus pantothenticus]|uniref:hypothetical protein n=1 Tax=Virgibacillus pantothenticus TaxID=1473 RepID=UPI0012FECD7C|nr:hypothetical protein [Virgibacillus pantothenticus]MED3735291.1 hypothetical protein [Virgibacillus pantothenticus]QTY18680.1 hypothetical protein KBP50_04725 [Virgibacillus pantothenticus]
MTKEGKGAMTKTPITLQELRQRIYQKAKAEQGALKLIMEAIIQSMGHPYTVEI